MGNKGFKTEGGTNRDIRAPEWDKDDFGVFYTDSTCPFTKVLDQIKQPHMSYYFALNHEPRLDEMLNAGWNAVDPSRIANRVTFNTKKRDPDERQCIRVNDTVVLERDERYTQRENEIMNHTNANKVRNAISACDTTTVNSLTNPFGR